MKKQILTFDYSSSKALQMFFLYNNVINKYKDGRKIYDDEIRMMYYYLFGNENLNKNQQEEIIKNHFRDFYGIFSLLTLYDTIKLQEIKTHYSDFSNYDISNLGEIGIEFETPLKKCPSKHIIAQAKMIFNLHRKKVISDFMQDCEAYYFENYPNDWIIDYYIEHNLFLEQYKNSKKYIPIFSFRNYWDKYEMALFSYLDAVFNGIINSIKTQNENHYSPIFSISQWNSVNINDYKEINANALLLNFSSCISIIPRPESFNDIYSIRNDPQMISFRKIYSDWVEVLRNGDINLAIKMKSDVEKANKALEKIDKICKLDKNIFYVAIKTLITFDPQIAIMLAATDLIKAYILDYQKQKNSWVLMPGFQPQYKNFIKN